MAGDNSSKRELELSWELNDMPRPNSPGGRRWWDVRARANNERLREKGRNVRRPQSDNSLTLLKLSLSAIFSQTSLVKTASRNPKTILIFQILVLTITTASIGTLIAKLVPEAAINDASNGVYIAGLVFILLLETIYQWGLRAATLATEEGITAYVQVESPDTDAGGLRSELEKQRVTNEERLKRTLEPVERVTLLAIAILTHLIALESASGDETPAWAITLAKDWAMTLLLGAAGLLWQLKNQGHISTLTNGTWIERALRFSGNKLLIFIIPVEAIVSVVILTVAYYPWGTLSALPLLLGVTWYSKKMVEEVRIPKVGPTGRKSRR